MSPIRLYDRLVWRPQSVGENVSFSLRYDDSTARGLRCAAPPDRSNLVWRAVELLALDAGILPYGEIVLTKRIPIQAGLGGGSSDAAAALLLANAAWKLDYPRARLAGLAAQLGSDVPFFLSNGPALCRGRGERVEPVQPFAPLNVVVVAPPAGVSTAAAFNALDAAAAKDLKTSEPRLANLLNALRRGRVVGLRHCMFNRLQSVAANLCPWTARLGTVFASTACHAHLLTGSGSAYFGVMRSARHARHVAAQLSAANLGTVFASATCR
jgi:4-diphosphocytidyl-2-C-methyl-D-erythritol kinase